MSLQQSEMLKHIGDAGFFGATLAAFLSTWTPVLTFLTVAATLVWAVYRIIDLRLTIAIKRKQLGQDARDIRQDARDIRQDNKDNT